jgi:hypothetical protein
VKIYLKISAKKRFFDSLIASCNRMSGSQAQPFGKKC